MRILFAGTPQTAVPSLHRLIEDGFEIAAVLTRAPAPVGRKRVLTPSAVHDAAAELGIPVLTPKSLRTPEIQTQISELAPQAVAVVAYGLIIPESLLEVPTHGWVNLHFSLLPRWRGAAPVNYAIAAGDTKTGLSIFQIEKGLDTGPIFAQEETPIGAQETAGELLARLAHSGATLLSRTLQDILAGTAHATPQTGTPTLAPQFRSAWAQINWETSAAEIAARIRAATPAPGAWTLLEGQRVKIAPVEVASSLSESSASAGSTQTPATGSESQTPALAPGEIGEDGYVGTATEPVRLTRLAPAGKSHMDARDWLRGARLAPGTRFTSPTTDTANSTTSKATKRKDSISEQRAQ